MKRLVNAQAFGQVGYSLRAAREASHARRRTTQT